MSVRRLDRRSRDAGSTLVEMLVASTLGLIALGILGTSVVPSLTTLARTGASDEDMATLDAFAGMLVRRIASARSGPADPAVALEGDRILLRVVTRDGPSQFVVALNAGVLTVDESDGPSESGGSVAGTRIEGLDHPSRIELLDPTGAATDDASLAVAVHIHLQRGGRLAERLVHIRR